MFLGFLFLLNVVKGSQGQTWKIRGVRVRPGQWTFAANSQSKGNWIRPTNKKPEIFIDSH